MLEYRRMTEADKYRIAAWKYPGEYALYNLPPYEEDRKQQAGFAAPGFVGFAFFQSEALVGFTTLYEEENEVMLGIGVAPECCDKGYGQNMVRITCEISQTLYPGKGLYLEVRSWNARAIRCYEKAGFVLDGEPFTQVTGLGEGEFYRIVKKKR